MRGPLNPGSHREIRFHPYRLDLDAGFLRSGDQAISLRPKTWAVLCYLAERPGLLVTKEELLNAVWGGTTVTEATLTKSIGEIREALHDEVRRPRFLETVHRRGFRFVSPVESPDTSPRVVTGASRSGPLVARDTELSRLRDHLAAARAGSRQTVFVTGEAGIGKTTLIDAFLAGLSADPEMRDCAVASGQCVHRHGGQEPLMPVLEAVARLARGAHATRVVKLLRDHAPAWLIQMPWLVEAGELGELTARLSSTTPERMLRLFAYLVEELTRETTLVLVLEDLHWADTSTVDLVSILAQRPEPARLLLLGSYRPADAIVSGAAFDDTRRSLATRRRCHDVPLSPLPPAAVDTYLAVRFDGHPAPSRLVRLLHAQTDGNPLFLVAATDHLLERGWITPGDNGVTVTAGWDALERSIPGSIRDLIEAQLAALDPFEVSVLEAASVAGTEFGAQVVAAAIEATTENVEDACERFVRGQRFLRAGDTEAWPDGAVAGRYAFTHAMYQRVLLHRIPSGRRRVWHNRIGVRLETGFAGRAAEVATELAAHFASAGDSARAITWLESAAASATRRFAPREAAGYLRRALEFAAVQSDGPERWRREIGLCAQLGAAVIATQGFAAQEAWDALHRALSLAPQVGNPLDVFHILYMLANASLARADAVWSPRLADELMRAAEQIGSEEALLVAGMLSANGALWQGNHSGTKGLADAARADPVALGRFVPGENPVAWARSVHGWRLWLLGQPDQALASARAGIECGRSLRNPCDLAMTLALSSQVHLWRGDLDEAAAAVAEGTEIAREHGLVLWYAMSRSVAGGVSLRRGQPTEAVPDLEQALGDLRRIGVTSHVPALLLGLAEASLQLGRPAEGLAAVEEGTALAETALCQWHAPELWRVRGELLAAEGAPSDAVESSLGRALELARAQHARAFELRAATSLARHLAGRRQKAAARTILAPIYGAFTEGLDTADLQAARALAAA